MKMNNIVGGKYELEIFSDGTKAYVKGGKFGEMLLTETPLFCAALRNTVTGESVEISSASEYGEVAIKEYGAKREFCFRDPPGVPGLTISVYCHPDENGVSWETEVGNASGAWSVMKISYPLPAVTAPAYALFLPYGCGKVVENAEKATFVESHNYLGLQFTMSYFAAYGRKGGIYYAVEDELAATKDIKVECAGGKTSVSVGFFGINAGEPANSFKLFGRARWRYFDGDWYDATKLYADFIVKKAKWLPSIGENGREDTPEKFKDVAYWVCDYIPNDEHQRDNKPMHLSAGSDICEPDYWYKAVIKLQEELNVPVAYHVYNWHSNPFNIEYPHYLPAKKGFKEGLAELKKRPIYVLPYINAVSWEMNDTEGGHEVNFDNTGKYCAVTDPDGKITPVRYPQTTERGKPSDLAPMCPACSKWHDIIGDVVGTIESGYGADGVYFDETAAHPPKPCFNRSHPHLPGGGNYWVEGSNRMMTKIRSKKPKDGFYFTEGNGEAYMKSFDGFLTWVWVHNGEVPAFPAIYAGYVEMIGRVLIGKKKDDTDFFKYSLSKSFLYGQQLGWAKADVIYDPYRMEYLKKIVALRYKYNRFFHRASMLRPPVIKSDIEPITTSPAIWHREDIVMEQMLCGAWKERKGGRTAIFVFNNSDKQGRYEMTFRFDEYGIAKEDLPGKGRSVTGGVCKVTGELPPLSYTVYEFTAKE